MAHSPVFSFLPTFPSTRHFDAVDLYLKASILFSFVLTGGGGAPKITAVSSSYFSVSWRAWWGLWLPLSLASVLEKHLTLMGKTIGYTMLGFSFHSPQNESYCWNDYDLPPKGVLATYTFIGTKSAHFLEIKVFCSSDFLIILPS